MAEINKSNHWSRRPWIAVEGELVESILIYTDKPQRLLIEIHNPAGLNADDRQLANHIIELHNKTLTREVKHAEDSSR